MDAGVVLGAVLVICALYIAVKLCQLYIQVKEELSFMKGQFEIMRTVPVLRQYVKEFVPVEITPEREKELQAKMEEQAQEWEKVYGFAPEQPKPFRPKVLKADMINETDLV